MSTNDLNNLVESNELHSELRYVESEELEKTWKSTRRERHKLQENNIWQHFCGDQDVLTTVSSDDPYQFIEDIPEWQLQQLIQIEVEKVAKMTQQLHHNVIEEEIGDGIPSLSMIITENDDDIKADEADDNEKVLEVLKSPLPTVRECVSEQLAEEDAQQQPPAEPVVNNEQKESTVYCNKIKELRDKINDSILGTINCLDNHSFENVFSEDIVKMKKHSAEFCMRFNRVYLYQIQRQLSDVRRHDSHSLPFAKYTHFQAQMFRATSLHQNILHAFNILNKTYAQSLMMGDTSNQLKILISNMRETTDLCVKITEPIDVKIVQELYNDDVMSSCNTLEERLIEYEQNLKELFHNTFQSISSKQQINIKKSQKSAFQSGYAVNSFKTDTRAKLAKSSLDKTVSNANLKENKSCSKIKKAPPVSKSQPKEADKAAPKAVKKNSSFRYSRRPLMSSRGSRSPTSKRHAHSDDIQTLVENIETQSKKSTPRTFRNNSERNKKTQHSLSKAADEMAVICENGSKTTEPSGANKSKGVDGVAQKIEDTTQSKCAAEVSELLRVICSNETTSSRPTRTPKAKNVQLVNIKSVSPRSPTVPEQLKMLDEKIQKKYPKEASSEKHLLSMSPTAELQRRMQDYRTQYIGHMLKSPLYANVNFNKPWELVARVSDNIIDELVSACSQEMQLLAQVNDLYKSEIL